MTRNPQCTCLSCQAAPSSFGIFWNLHMSEHNMLSVLMCKTHFCSMLAGFCAWLDSAIQALFQYSFLPKAAQPNFAGSLRPLCMPRLSYLGLVCTTSWPQAVAHQSLLQALTMYVIAAGPACQLAAPQCSWGLTPRIQVSWPNCIWPSQRCGQGS